MSLPEHLHPKTYWEKRCEVLEQSVRRLMDIVANYSLPPAAISDMDHHFKDWNRIHDDLIAEHPAPLAAALAGDREAVISPERER